MTTILTKDNAHKLESMLQKDLDEQGHDVEVSVSISGDGIEVDEAKPTDPTSADAQLADWASRVEEQEREVARLEGEWNVAKAEAKAAKENYELGVATLRRIVREHNDPQRTLPFDGSKEQPADDAWRAVTLEDLGFSGQIYLALAEAGLKTLGAIADHTAEHELTDIKGIGPGKATNIEERLEQWWRDHPEFTPTEPEGESD